LGADFQISKEDDSVKDELLEFHREFMKDNLRKMINFSQTDQGRKVPPPPVQKPYDSDSIRIPLPPREEFSGCIKYPDLFSAIQKRESRRKYSILPMSLTELSFLLWCTQGIKSMPAPEATLRTVPSAGARHSFETYLFIRSVLGLDEGLYRYLPVEHELLAMGQVEKMTAKLVKACLGQGFLGAAAATFVWAAVPYRMEWRYAHCAHRVMLMDVGHVCQNLYLACEAIGAGTCGVAAYDQEELDRLLGLNGEDEFAIYLAPVGKI
jgi:SagB-type dehydrogenase family enzyme